MAGLKLINAANDILVRVYRAVSFMGRRWNLIRGALTALTRSVFNVRLVIDVIANFFGAWVLAILMREGEKGEVENLYSSTICKGSRLTFPIRGNLWAQFDSTRLDRLTGGTFATAFRRLELCADVEELNFTIMAIILNKNIRLRWSFLLNNWTRFESFFFHGKH